MPTKPLSEVRHQWLLSLAEVGRLLGISESNTGRYLYDENDERVKAKDVEPGDAVYLVVAGRRIPVHKQNGQLKVWRHEAEAAIGASL